MLEAANMTISHAYVRFSLHPNIAVRSTYFRTFCASALHTAPDSSAGEFQFPEYSIEATALIC